MKLIDFFDCVYVINLPERLDRRKQIEQELEDAGMPFQPGKVELFEAIKVTSAAGFESVGGRGCFMSHLAIYQEAKRRGLSNVLVLEDDLVFLEHFKLYEDRLIEQLQRYDWDIVLFGYMPPGVALPGEPNFATIQPTMEHFTGTHFYGANGKAFDRLIAAFEKILSIPEDYPENVTRFPDGIFWDLAEEGDFLRLKAMPSFGNQRSSRSDCAPNPKWFDQIPITQQAASMLRELGVIGMVKALAGR